MARYVKTIPMKDVMENSFSRIRQYLESKKFKYRTRDGEQLFQKGDGVWVAASFVKVTYAGGFARVEAWIDAMGAEQNLDGFVGCAAKKPLKKIVERVEEILNTPNPNFVPGEQKVEQPVIQQEQVPNQTAARLPEGISKQEYFKKYASESFYRDVKIAAIIGYVCAGLNAAVSILVSLFGLLDSVIFLALVLGMHLKKSKGCAIAITVYAAFSMVMGLVFTGTVSGWLWLVVGVTSLIAFKNAEKRYKALTNE